jgi:hypothetical protein
VNRPVFVIVVFQRSTIASGGRVGALPASGAFDWRTIFGVYGDGGLAATAALFSEEEIRSAILEGPSSRGGGHGT